ncbi:MAG: Lar family restriction alleviation protein [Pseudomonas fluorescens]
MSIELKSCPFCGAAAKLCVADYVDRDNKEIPIVECSQCSAWVKPDDWQSRAPVLRQGEAQPVDFDYPEYREQGMGCGLEDRGITDRYEACRYGFDEALDQFAQMIDGMGPLYRCADADEVERLTRANEALINQRGEAWLERDALRTELTAANDKYQRDVNGLNNEGDPIGGDPAGGYSNEVSCLRARLADVQADSNELFADREVFAAQRDKARELLNRAEHCVSEIAATGRPGAAELAGDIRALRMNSYKPETSAAPRDPCKWTDREVLDFLGVALRNVDLVGTVHLNEIRQGFEYIRDKAASASAEPGVGDE